MSVIRRVQPLSVSKLDPYRERKIRIRVVQRLPVTNVLSHHVEE
jgi:hypothetical protein